MHKSIITILGYFLFLAGVLSLMASVVITPGLAERYLSADHHITPSGLETLRDRRLMSAIAGGALLAVGVIVVQYREYIQTLLDRLMAPESSIGHDPGLLRAFALILVVISLSVALAGRVIFAARIPHPGHGDHAFYYTLAENIADGRGFVIDYIWQYLSDPKEITHSSNDYWMPLTSVIISFVFSVFGKNLFVALLPSILAGLFLALLAYFVAKIHFSSRVVSIGSFCLTLLAPTLFKWSLLTDCTIYYALFASLSLIFMIKGKGKPVFFLLSAAFAGLAHLTRQDGVLLVPLLLGTIVLSSQSRKEKLLHVCSSLILYLLILFR